MNTFDLYQGGTTDPDGRLCIMNAIDRKWKLANNIPLTRLTDMPECTSPAVARALQVVNDRLAVNRKLPESAAARLLAREKSIMGAMRLSPKGEIRIAVAAARRVQHLAGDPSVGEALDLVERWLVGDDVSSEELLAARKRARDAAAAAAYAAAAASASASAAAYAAAYAYATASAAYATADDATATSLEDALIEFVDDLLAAHEKAAAEEGKGMEMAERRAQAEAVSGTSGSQQVTP